MDPSPVLFYFHGEGKKALLLPEAEKLKETGVEGVSQKEPGKPACSGSVPK